jgi:hypothetical protein
MIIETIVWILFTIFIIWLSALKTKHFMKEKRFKNYFKAYTKLKDQPTITKTLDDKKDYLRQKTEGGNDIVQVVISAIMFLGIFVTLIYRNIPAFTGGIIVALIFSLIISFIFAKLQFSGVIYEFKFIDSFISYWYASTFLVYVKFLDNMYPLLLMVISITIMIFVNKWINKGINEGGK